jgi:hypothetical protein
MNDVLQRTLLSFITLQNCASNFGWTPNCHNDDSIHLANGEVRSLSGGLHQSSDLRKWSFGSSLAGIGLLKYALLKKPIWDDGVIEREVRNLADYFMKLTLGTGSLIYSTFVPVDGEGTSLPKRDSTHLASHGVGYGDYQVSWNRREFFEKVADAPSHWQFIRFFSLAYSYFKNCDADYAQTCLTHAKKIFNFMSTDSELANDYFVPLYPPLGHEGLHKIFQGYYKNSSLELAGKACAAIELYRATMEDQFAEIAESSLEFLIKNQVTEGVCEGAFWEGSRDKLANNYYYFFNSSVPFAFIDALEVFTDSKGRGAWKNALKSIIDLNVRISSRNSFDRLHGILYTENAFAENAFFSYSEELEEKRNFYLGELEGNAVHYEYYSFCYNFDLILGAIIFKKSAELLKEPILLHYSQAQIDWLLGVNPWSASSIEGIGFNQPHRGIFGEFFPPVPQIPGAIFTGLTDHSFNSEANGLECEYDVPYNSWMMYLMEI